MDHASNTINVVITHPTILVASFLSPQAANSQIDNQFKSLIKIAKLKFRIILSFCFVLFFIFVTCFVSFARDHMSVFVFVCMFNVGN